MIAIAFINTGTSIVSDSQPLNTRGGTQRPATASANPGHSSNTPILTNLRDLKGFVDFPWRKPQSEMREILDGKIGDGKARRK